jgi:dipeptidyl aminopeptidase/acylaminoacyl peptidase
MTRTETTTAKTHRPHHHFLRTLLVALAVAAALAMAFAADDALAKKRPPAPVQGPTIAFTSTRDGNYEIYKMNEDGSKQTNLTNNGATDDQAAVSPDGTKIAFTTDRSGNEDIYKMNRDGSSPVQLTNNAADDFNADWAKKASS